MIFCSNRQVKCSSQVDESFKEKFEIKVIGETSVSPPEELLVRFCSSRLKLHSSG